MHQSQHTINISERKEKKKKSEKFCIPRFIDSLKRARSKNLQIKKTGMQFPTEGHAICKGRKRKTQLYFRTEILHSQQRLTLISNGWQERDIN